MYSPSHRCSLSPHGGSQRAAKLREGGGGFSNHRRLFIRLDSLRVLIDISWFYSLVLWVVFCVFMISCVFFYISIDVDGHVFFGSWIDVYIYNVMISVLSLKQYYNIYIYICIMIYNMISMTNCWPLIMGHFVAPYQVKSPCWCRVKILSEWHKKASKAPRFVRSKLPYVTSEKHHLGKIKNQ